MKIEVQEKKSKKEKKSLKRNKIKDFCIHFGAAGNVPKTKILAVSIKGPIMKVLGCP